MSELAGLSAEEAALINDVLTRLSIGHNAQAVPGLRVRANVQASRQALSL